MSRKKQISFGILVSALVLMAAVAPRLVSALRQPEREIPTTRVRRGDLEIKVYTTGELRAAQSAMLVAPAVSGSLQIIYLAPTGTRVKTGEVVIEFDPGEQEYNLEQSRSELQQADQEIIKLRADTAVREAQDRVNLLTARFDVRRAELEVSRNEVISAIDAKKNVLTLEETKRRLEQLSHDLQSRATSDQAALAVLEEKRTKAQLKMNQAQQNIENMKVKSSIDGLVGVKENPDASGGIYYSGMSLPEYHEGDQVFPGRFVAEVLEVDQMEIQAKVDENDRANLTPEQSVEVRLDASPDQKLQGKIKTIAGMAARRYWDINTTAKFDATFRLDKADPTLRSGYSAQVVIASQQIKGALYLPRQALFEKEGEFIVYVKAGHQFEPRKIKVVHRTESNIVVEGVTDGMEVALSNPEDRRKKPEKAAALEPGAINGGGR